MDGLKALARAWLPPAVVRWIGQQRQRDRIHFEGEFASWEEARAHCHGYDAESILAKVLAATLKVKSGEAVFERDSVLFYEREYVWPVIAGLLWSASQNGGRLNVLDFGGALGSSFFQNRSFLEASSELRWNVVEQEHYVNAGRANIQTEQLKFYQTIDECLRENQPNIVLLSGVLQYLSDPGFILSKLISVGATAIVVDRTIVNRSSSNRIYVQHVPPSIYSASYPCWSLSESFLLGALGPRYVQLGDFQSLDFPALKSIDSEFKGYIWVRPPR